MMRANSILLKEGLVYAEGAFERLDIRIQEESIADLSPNLALSIKDVIVDASSYCILPGLINSHDHLEFNLFPPLGSPPYKNYVEWADDVQKNYREQIESILQIPLEDRLLWGGYKNLFSGVTTVFHHNPFHRIFKKAFPVRVFDNYHWIHSLRLDGSLRSKLASRDGKLCAIHIAEGIDEIAEAELSDLDLMGGLTERTLIVHGIAFRDGDVQRMIERRAALAWCPSSNFFLYGKTAPVERLVGKIPVGLGTDSAISGGSDLIDEMRFALKLKSCSAEEIVEMVTRVPARVMGMNSGEIEVGRTADLVLFQVNNTANLESFLSEISRDKIAGVFQRGSPVLGNGKLEKLFDRAGKRLSRIDREGEVRFVIGNLPQLVTRIKRYLPHFQYPFDGISST